MSKKISFAAAAVLLVVFVPLIAAELYVRIFSPAGYFTPTTLKAQSLQFKGAVFSKYVLDAKEHRMTNSLGARYRINPRGTRGGDFQVPKPEGVFRIVFYGGSSVFDIGASEGEDWPSRVEKNLHEQGHSEVEIINAAVPGHASHDSVGSLFAEGHLWQPDMVVLYTAWNDFPALTDERPLQRFLKPYDEKADPLLNERGRLDRLLCSVSQVYVRLRYRYFLWKYQVGLEGARSREKNISRLAEAGLSQFRLTLETFADVARNAKAVPVLMTEAHPFQRGNDRAADLRYWENFQALTLDAMYEAKEKTAEMVRQTAEIKQTPLIDSASVLDGKAEFFRDHVHVNGAGSEKLAQFTAARLSEILEKESSATSKTSPAV